MDFNRLPSQMSMYAVDIDRDHGGADIFTHIRGRSTPQPIRGPVYPPVSPLITSGSNNDDTKTKGNTDHDWTTRTKLYSPWISDSIISPPSYHERQRKKYEPGYKAMDNLEDMELSTSRVHFASLTA